MSLLFSFFFFQAEDGIRDYKVTGVQTCALPIFIDLKGEATPMEGDEDLLHRVVSNLVLNAVQAAGKGARVVVRTGRPAAHELPGGAGIETPVSLAVSDNGPGYGSLDAGASRQLVREIGRAHV